MRCGETVGKTCIRQKFLDGNFSNLTNTVNVRQGMEVQHRPSGQQVVTVIARNTTKGQEYDIGRGDLLQPVQDLGCGCPSSDPGNAGICHARFTAGRRVARAEALSGSGFRNQGAQAARSTPFFPGWSLGGDGSARRGQRDRAHRAGRGGTE